VIFRALAKVTAIAEGSEWLPALEKDEPGA
jgi:hypothetical protein